MIAKTLFGFAVLHTMAMAATRKQTIIRKNMRKKNDTISFRLVGAWLLRFREENDNIWKPPCLAGQSKHIKLRPRLRQNPPM